MNDIMIPKGQLALTGDVLELAIAEQRRSRKRSSVNEYLLKYKCFFHDYKDVKFVLGKQTIGLEELGERIVRNPEEDMRIGENSIKSIDCLSKLKDYISTVLEIEPSDVPYIPFLHHSEYLTHTQLLRCQMILRDVLAGNCFYEEVKLIIANETIEFIHINERPLDRPIEINGETYLFRLVLSSILNCLSEYEYVYGELYDEEKDDNLMRKKREELRRKLLLGEDDAIVKDEDRELPFHIDERDVIVPHSTNSSDVDDGANALRELWMSKTNQS